MGTRLRLNFILLLAVALSAAVQVGLAQQLPPLPRVATPVNRSEDPLLSQFRWRSIGPAAVGGRIDDVAVSERDPFTYYVGFATGGIWKTTNNGTTWAPIFDEYATGSIGDIALAPSNPEVLYVGTGEPNNRNSSSFGDGVYKSVDGGRTFRHMGLKDTQSIGRIVVHPTDPGIAYVAAVGHLFGPNAERGVFKTVDGGTTWTKVKFVNDDTGFTDLIMDPSNPNTLFAASYVRRRTPWGFNGGGRDSGIWRTDDAGKTWEKLQGNGLPTEPVLGRIALDFARSSPNVLYAQIEVGFSGGVGSGVQDDGTPAAGGLVEMRARPDVELPLSPSRSGIWRSDDKGKTWRLMSNENDRPTYFSQIRVDPNNPEIVYAAASTLRKSTDGAKTFTTVQSIQYHSDHHALWIDPRDSRRIISGNDHGLDISHDQGTTWDFVDVFPAGQFYAISADMRKPYWVCGGLQDNGSWCGPSATRNRNGILNNDWFRIGGADGMYSLQDPSDWRTIYSEAQYGAIGGIIRFDLGTGTRVDISPRVSQAASAGGAAVASNIVPSPPGGTQYRFYWNSPLLLSPHNPSVIYSGAERLFKSVDRGDTWTVSPDLTKNLSRFDRPILGIAGSQPMAAKHDGVATYSNIVTIAESGVMPGVLWIGTNDGNVQISRDGGNTWTNVIGNVPGVPAETHVSRVEASHFDPGTAYVTFDGHRTDDHTPYVFVTRDYGLTWRGLAAGLPPGNVNVIREDPRNRNLLFLGTENAFYISLDGGGKWQRFMTGLPTVPIADILVHPRDNDLIVGTHGRSIYVIDDITPLQQLSEEVRNKPSHLFDIRPAVAWGADPSRDTFLGGQRNFRGENPPRGVAISYHLGAENAAPVTIEIADYAGQVVRSFKACAPGTAISCATNAKGLNRVWWDLNSGPLSPGGARTPQPLPPGSYLVRLVAGGATLMTKAVIELDLLDK